MTVTISGTDGFTTPGLTNTGTETLVNLTTTGNTTLGDASTDTLNVGNGGLIKDASGNLGVGVTPSAWTNYKAIQLGGGSLSSYSDNNYIELSQNGYYASGVYKYVNTGYASKYQQNTGTHQWYVAASGTAGNTISFTQAMTLDAIGNLMVGTTTAAPNTISSTYIQSRLGTVGNMYSGISSTFGFVLTSNSYQYSGGTNRKLVSGYTSRLDLRSDDGTITTATATTGAADSNITFQAGPYIVNLGTSWTNTSDERLKNITGEIQNGVEKVMSLRAAEFTWKEGSNTKPQVGLIAQDLLAVLPEVVVVPETDTDSEGNKKYLGVNYDQVTALLVAAIKEQQALITTLTDRITALENK